MNRGHNDIAMLHTRSGPSIPRREVVFSARMGASSMSMAFNLRSNATSNFKLRPSASMRSPRAPCKRCNASDTPVPTTCSSPHPPSSVVSRVRALGVATDRGCCVAWCAPLPLRFVLVHRTRFHGALGRRSRMDTSKMDRVRPPDMSSKLMALPPISRTSRSTNGVLPWNSWPRRWSTPNHTSSLGLIWDGNVAGADNSKGGGGGTHHHDSQPVVWCGEVKESRSRHDHMSHDEEHFGANTHNIATAWRTFRRAFSLFTRICRRPFACCMFHCIEASEPCDRMGVSGETWVDEKNHRVASNTSKTTRGTRRCKRVEDTMPTTTH